ncbi:MAG: GNAT family N-acetyltransferase [archaeon]
MEVVAIHRIRLETNRLVLRDLEERDAKHLANHLASLTVTRYLALVPHPYGLADAKSFIGNKMSEQGSAERKSFPLAITLNQTMCIK